jgi:nuclear pore complex protein Nup93
VSSETAFNASEECEKMLRMTDRAGRPSYDRKKLILYAIISGSRRQIERMLRDLPNLFTTIEDFLWFKLSAVRDPPTGASSSFFSTEGLNPYTLEDLQNYLNKFEPAYYTKNGRDPLVYPYVLLLSVQFLPAILYLSKEGEDGVSIDAVHIAICLADSGVLLEGSGNHQKAGLLMDACAEVSGVIRQYGSVYLRNGNVTNQELLGLGNTGNNR